MAQPRLTMDSSFAMDISGLFSYAALCCILLPGALGQATAKAQDYTRGELVGIAVGSIVGGMLSIVAVVYVTRRCCAGKKRDTNVSVYMPKGSDLEHGLHHVELPGPSETEDSLSPTAGGGAAGSESRASGGGGKGGKKGINVKKVKGAAARVKDKHLQVSRSARVDPSALLEDAPGGLSVEMVEYQDMMLNSSSQHGGRSASGAGGGPNSSHHQQQQDGPPLSKSSMLLRWLQCIEPPSDMTPRNPYADNLPLLKHAAHGVVWSKMPRSVVSTPAASSVASEAASKHLIRGNVARTAGPGPEDGDAYPESLSRASVGRAAAAVANRQGIVFDNLNGAAGSSDRLSGGRRGGAAGAGGNSSDNNSGVQGVQHSSGSFSRALMDSLAKAKAIRQASLMARSGGMIHGLSPTTSADHQGAATAAAAAGDSAAAAPARGSNSGQVDALLARTPSAVSGSDDVDIFSQNVPGTFINMLEANAAQLAAQQAHAAGSGGRPLMLHELPPTVLTSVPETVPAAAVGASEGGAPVPSPTRLQQQQAAAAHMHAHAHASSSGGATELSFGSHVPEWSAGGASGAELPPGPAADAGRAPRSRQGTGGGAANPGLTFDLDVVQSNSHMVSSPQPSPSPATAAAAGGVLMPGALAPSAAAAAGAQHLHHGRFSGNGAHANGAAGVQGSPVSHASASPSPVPGSGMNGVVGEFSQPSMPVSPMDGAGSSVNGGIAASPSQASLPSPSMPTFPQALASTLNSAREGKGIDSARELRGGENGPSAGVAAAVQPLSGAAAAMHAKSLIALEDSLL